MYQRMLEDTSKAADAIRDKYIAGEFGGKTTADINADKTAEAKAQLADDKAALKRMDVEIADGVEPRALSAARQELEDLSFKTKDAADALSVARKNNRTERREALNKAIDAEADARERVAINIEGKDKKTAREERLDFMYASKASGQRQAAVAAQKARKYDSIEDPQERRKAAEADLEKFAPGTEEASAGLEAQMQKLQNKLDRAETPEEIAELQRKIEGKQKRLPLPPPIYEAAQQVLAEGTSAERRGRSGIKPCRPTGSRDRAGQPEPVSTPSEETAATVSDEVRAAPEAMDGAMAAQSAITAAQGLSAAGGGAPDVAAVQAAETATDAFLDAADVQGPQRVQLRANILAGRTKPWTWSMRK